eukprot:m.87388 g.87388  ORF g.87388 m.87388 type:complete len:773 (+) comp9699_c0_seq1:327-2645(+)
MGDRGFAMEDWHGILERPPVQEKRSEVVPFGCVGVLKLPRSQGVLWGIPETLINAEGVPVAPPNIKLSTGDIVIAMGVDTLARCAVLGLPAIAPTPPCSDPRGPTPPCEPGSADAAALGGTPPRHPTSGEPDAPIRIRVWVPQPINQACWVHQYDAKGVPCIEWLPHGVYPNGRRRRSTSPPPPPGGRRRARSVPTMTSLGAVGAFGHGRRVMAVSASLAGLRPFDVTTRGRDLAVGNTAASTLNDGDLVFLDESVAKFGRQSPLARSYTPPQDVSVTMHPVGGPLVLASRAVHGQHSRASIPAPIALERSESEHMWIPKGRLGPPMLDPSIFVSHRIDAIPTAVLADANAALDKLVQLNGSPRRLDSGKPGPVDDALDLFSDAIWLDRPGWRLIVDPNLCVCPINEDVVAVPPAQHAAAGGLDTSSPSWRWQPSEVTTDSQYHVTWQSFANHLDQRVHGSVIASLGALMECALPVAEAASGMVMRESRLQVVVGAYEQHTDGPVVTMPLCADCDSVPDAGDGQGQRLATDAGLSHRRDVGVEDLHPPLKKDGDEHLPCDWCYASHACDHIAATVVCYLGVQSAHSVSFEMAPDLCQRTSGLHHTVDPAMGSVVGFDSRVFWNGIKARTTLSHHPYGGYGQGADSHGDHCGLRMVVFHFVDPRAESMPMPSRLPRQLESQRRRDVLDALASCVDALLGERDFPFPTEMLEYIYTFVPHDGVSAHAVVARRDLLWYHRHHLVVPPQMLVANVHDHAQTVMERRTWHRQVHNAT